MAETTGIAWTDATQNFWEGCTKVGPGCDHCYAENRDQRFHSGSHWGTGAPRRRMVETTFRRPLAWNASRAQYDLAKMYPGRWPSTKPAPPLWVFTLSLGDFFDNEVAPAWRADAWAIIKDCTHLRWQIVTKRVGNVRKMLPADWDDGSAYRHVGIIATTVTQQEYDRDVVKLHELKFLHGVKWIGLSIEPQIEMITLGRNAGFLDWVICGGESKQGAGHVPRPFYFKWVYSLLYECRLASVPVFVKQMGDAMGLKAHAGADPEEWPGDLRVRQMPRIYDAA